MGDCLLSDTFSRAIALIPDDIIICDWQYSLHAEYPSVRRFADRGLRLLTCGWDKVIDTLAFLHSGRRDGGEKWLGHICTTWSLPVPLEEFAPFRAAMRALSEGSMAAGGQEVDADWAHMVEWMFWANALKGSFSLGRDGTADIPGQAAERIALLVNGLLPGREDELVAFAAPSVLANSEQTSQGAFRARPADGADPWALVVEFPPNTTSEAGDAWQATLQLPVGTRRADGEQRRFVELSVYDNYIQPHISGYRFYQLLAAGEVLWELDIAESLACRPRVDVSGLAEGRDRLELTLRIVDKKPVGNYGTTSFIGPMRIVSVAQ